MMRKSIRLVAAFCGVLFVATGTAHAALVALSINMGNGTFTVSGPAGVDGYSNWNNMTSASSFSTAGSMVLSNGQTATGVKIDAVSGYDVYTGVAPTGGTAGDQALMSNGPRINGQAGGQIFIVGVRQISGLSNIFKNGYTVRSYQDFLTGFQSSASAGHLYVSKNAADFGLSTAQGTPYTTYNTANVVGSATWGPTTNTAFTGLPNVNANYLTNGFYTTTGLIGTNSSDTPDLIVIHNSNDFTNNGFSAATWNGIQIVGEVADPAPEPSTYALGLVGLVGLGATCWLRRKS